jgi:hypothetical protein
VSKGSYVALGVLMKVRFQAKEHQIIEEEIFEIEKLVEVIVAYNLNNFYLNIKSISYHLSQTSKCPDKEYPRIIVYKPEVIVPIELTITDVSDLEYFLSQHPYSTYHLEIESRVFQMQKEGELQRQLSLR